MTGRIEIIANNIKKRKRKRSLFVLAIVALPIAMLSYMTIALSSKMPPSYPRSIPAASTSGTENPQNLLKKDTALVKVSRPSPPSENAATEQNLPLEILEDSLALGTQLSSSPSNLEKKEEAKVDSSPLNTKQPATVSTQLFIEMPEYVKMSLTRKMDLMRNNAYSPKDKAKLRQHIVNQFANRGRARVSVVDRRGQGQGETHSYPIGMYLDRLSNNPRVQFRLVEKVTESNRLSGLVVKE